MNWLILFIAGLLETGWAVGLKYSGGLSFSKPLASSLTIVAMIASMALLGIAMRGLPLGTAYAIWTGIGTAGAVIFGIFIFGDSAAFARLACVFLIIIGIAGLKLSTSA